MSFQALLDDLELLKKSMDEDDAKIADAAAEGVDEDDKREKPEGDAPEGDAPEGNGDGEPMGKSFEFELDNGERVQAFDATDLVKSLQEEVATLRKAPEAVGAAVDLIKSLQGQVSALTAKVAELGNQGRGRKAVLTVTEKPDGTLAKSEQPLDRESVMAKCLTAQRSGALSAVDVSRAETALNHGIPLPADIAARLQ